MQEQTPDLRPETPTPEPKPPRRVRKATDLPAADRQTKVIKPQREDAK